MANLGSGLAGKAAKALGGRKAQVEQAVDNAVAGDTHPRTAGNSDFVHQDEHAKTKGRDSDIQKKARRDIEAWIESGR